MYNIQLTFEHDLRAAAVLKTFLQAIVASPATVWPCIRIGCPLLLTGRFRNCANPQHAHLYFAFSTDFRAATGTSRGCKGNFCCRCRLGFQLDATNQTKQQNKDETALTVYKTDLPSQSALV
jgi:hypothetical protein